jgi:hypothetical protein
MSETGSERHLAERELPASKEHLLALFEMQTDQTVKAIQKAISR